MPSVGQFLASPAGAGGGDASMQMMLMKLQQLAPLLGTPEGREMLATVMAGQATPPAVTGQVQPQAGTPTGPVAQQEQAQQPPEKPQETPTAGGPTLAEKLAIAGQAINPNDPVAPIIPNIGAPSVNGMGPGRLIGVDALAALINPGQTTPQVPTLGAVLNLAPNNITG